MTLLVRELRDEDSQLITMTRDCNLAHIRPHLIRRGFPGGDVKVQIRDANGFLIDESDPVSIDSIGSLAFAHGYVKLDINTPLKNGETYEIRTVAFNGYSPTVDVLGICRDFDLRKVVAAYSPNDGFSSAFDLELWEKRMTDREVEFFDGFESAAEPDDGELQADILRR